VTKELAEARAAIARASSIAVLTGAGMASGRRALDGEDDPGTSWDFVPAAELATPDTFRRDPALVWRWYMARRAQLAGVKPGPGHLALDALAHRVQWFTLITQNIDGIQERAGGLQPLELHGNLWRTRCVGCGRLRRDARTIIDPLPPHCEHCGGILRPDVVWFGEALDGDLMERATRAVCVADVFIAVGTNGEPAPSLCGFARENGAFVIDVNLEDTPTARLADAALRGTADEVLPQLIP
jgi:NAD-dependent deacetylase